MEGEENCGSAEEQVEGRGEGLDLGVESRDVSGEEKGEVVVKEEGIEGDEKLNMEGEDEGSALSKPKKRGRKGAAGLSKNGEKEVVEEGKSSYIVAVKEEESGEKSEERTTFIENLEMANGEDGNITNEEVYLSAAANGKGNSGDDLKKRLRATPKRVNYAEILEYEDEGSDEKKRRRRGRKKRKVVRSGHQEDDRDNGMPVKRQGRRGRPRKQGSESECSDDNEDDGIPEKKKARRGRARKQSSESEGSEGKEVKEEGKEERKKRRRRGRKVGKKLDGVVGNEKSLEKPEDESLKTNTEADRQRRSSRVPKKEEPVLQTKRKTGRVKKLTLSCFYDVFSIFFT